MLYPYLIIKSTRMRTSSAQLPEIEEAKSIIEKEAQRNVESGKEDMHYVDFSLVIEWLRMLELDTEPFTEQLPWEETLTIGNAIREEVIQRTIVHNTEEQFQEVMKRVTAYLGEEDVPQSSDLIVVFGSNNPARMQTAIDLWKQGFAPYIFVSGGHPYFQTSEPEAEIFKKMAIEQGIPSEKIIIETEAITVSDNVKRTLNALEEKDLNFSKIILVTDWFAKRRAWAIMMKYIPATSEIYRVNAPVNPEGDYAPDRWFHNEKGIRLVFGEFVKMRITTLLNIA